jgi:hypothetical protein
MDEYEELVSPNKGKPVKRGKAQNYGRRLRLACATFPILGTNRLVELKRSPNKKILGDQWIFFLSEHAKHEDNEIISTLRRGVYEEVNYKFRRDFLECHKEGLLDISYEGANEIFYWSVGLFVVPIRSIGLLKPDGKEIIEIRERNIDEVFCETKKSDSIYKGFRPNSFLKILEQDTRNILYTYKDWLKHHKI